MPNPEEGGSISNISLQLADDFVRDTDKHVFLTGKAGTGKTTFLHGLRKSLPKRMIVTAPTGVAAINAGGVTLHSFFQLPFGPYVPGGEAQREVGQRRFSGEKINIMKSLDLLVIDEISMVRADLLDGVDAVLRRFKRKQLPFGGVQLLMIGDLQQLSPVVRDDEWNLLRDYYQSIFFFSSLALQQTDMITIELTQVYRQSDARFIQLLNRVREGRLDSDTITALNSRCLPDVVSQDHEGYITLTTHNRSADDINAKRLQALAAKSMSFQATVADDYPQQSYPVAENLALKKGAQVMFVRNDPEKRYFNGKIGKIVAIDKDCVKVMCDGDDEAIEVERVTWENIKYTLNTQSKDITAEVIGKFTQFPLRLAWAITIHKSQGLTFEKAIIDAQAAFSPGQVYVALSRCKTFEGMVLSTPIASTAVRTDTVVNQFIQHAGRNPPTHEQLRQAKIHYQQQVLQQCFSFHGLASRLNKLSGLMLDHRDIIRFTAMDALADLCKQADEQIFVVAEKFTRQLQSLFKPDKEPEQDPAVQERAGKAYRYFDDKMQSVLLRWTLAFQFDSDNKDVRQQINKAFEAFRRSLALKTAALQGFREGVSIRACKVAMARALVDYQPRSSRQPFSDVDASELNHPGLYQALRAWRAKQAAKEKVDPYRIMHQRVLVLIAEQIPDSVSTLRRIKGVGKQTINKYGEAISTIVRDFCREHAIELPQHPAQTTVVNKVQKKDTKQISYELYLENKDLEKIAETRGLVRSTIEGHLAHFVGLGLLDIKEFVPEEKISVIKKAFDGKGKESMKEVKHQLGDDFSYSEIRMVLETLR